MLGEGVRPGIGIAHIVDRAIHAELLPHEPGVVVGHRSVPIVRVAERCPLLEVTILTRARTRNHVPAAVPAGRQPRRTRLSSTAARTPHEVYFSLICTLHVAFVE